MQRYCNQDIRGIVRRALHEDSARRDITAIATIGRRKTIDAHAVMRQAGVVCGIEAARQAFAQLDPKCRFRPLASDGDRVRKGQTIARISGPARAVLSGERTALNFLQHLSGIATLTRKYVDKTRGTGAKIYDTRKTTPGLRVLEKYAVRCGGGRNHRMCLSDMALIKDNHIRAVKDIMSAVNAVRKRYPHIMVEVECDTLRQVGLALEAGADIIMLDNMSLAGVRKAVTKVRKYPGAAAKRTPQLEVSGGINLGNVAKYARLGCGRISVGALTHSAPALDISLDFD